MSEKPTKGVRASIAEGVGTAVGTGRAAASGASFTKPPEVHWIYNLIGRVASEWSHLESMLDFIIYNLADLEAHKGACITAQLMGVWPRISSIRALLTFHLPSVPALETMLKKLNKFEKSCREPSEKRNRIIHDPWWAEVTDVKLVAQTRSMPRSKLEHGLKDVDPMTFSTLLASIEALNMSAMQMFAEIDAARLASREKRDSTRR